MATKAPPPPPAKNGRPPAPTAQAAPTSSRQFAVVGGRQDRPQRVLIYGTAGVGKTTLASLAPSPVFLDLEQGSGALDVPRVEGIETWDDVRAVLNSSALDDYGTVVVDSGTRSEELAVAHTIATVPHEKGSRVKSIEGYGFGKGYQHVYETYLHLLADLDKQVRQGRHVVLICHECISDRPNPYGEDFIRYEPHLQSPKSGKSSIRNRVVQWADHVLFVAYDVVAEDGKGKGAGTRTIWTFELPSHVAKSHTTREALPFESPDDAAIWNLILGGAR